MMLFMAGFMLVSALVVKVFAKPLDEQEDEIFFFSMMFIVIAGGSAITFFFMVCNTSLVVICWKLAARFKKFFIYLNQTFIIK